MFTNVNRFHVPDKMRINYGLVFLILLQQQRKKICHIEIEKMILRISA